MNQSLIPKQQSDHSPTKETFSANFQVLETVNSTERKLSLATAESVVSADSTVELRDLQSGALRTCTIVEPEFVSLTAGAISILHPLGQALAGRVVGDIVDCWELIRNRRLQIECVWRNR